MCGYHCKDCQIYFEIGFVALMGGGAYTHYVCTHCGTMHCILHPQGKPDVLQTRSGPVHIEATPSFETAPRGEWKTVAELPTSEWAMNDPVIADRSQALDLQAVQCAFCGHNGTLVSEEWPRTPEGKWPVFGKHCPVCNSANVSCVFLVSIH